MRKKNKEKEISELCKTFAHISSEELFELPEVEIPEVEIPVTGFPEDELPKEDIPEVEIPEAGFPEEELPEYSFDDFFEDLTDNDDTDNSHGGSESVPALPPVSSSVYGVQIDGRNFEEAKNNLKDILERTKTNPELSRVKTSGGLFNLFPHNVTGDELNELTVQIQDYLISLNEFNGDIINRIGELYQTLDFLDNDYIQKIVISLQCAEKASQEAKDAGIDAQKALEETNKAVNDLAATQKSLQNAQKTLRDTNRKIDKTVSQLEKTILVLSRFKSDIDKIQHLKDLDLLWSEYQGSKESIDKLTEKLNVQEQTTQTLSNYFDDVWKKHTEVEEERKMSFAKKLTFAYALGGVSLCIALVTFVLLLLR